MPESLKLSGILSLFTCFAYLRKNEQNNYYEKTIFSNPNPLLGHDFVPEE